MQAPEAAEPPAKPAKRVAAPVPEPTEELKMVLCVNNELKMGKGKIAAQCCHAAVGVVQRFSASARTALKQWEMTGQKKIALKVDNTAALNALAKAAQDAGLPFYVVSDAGRTQIAAGSRTVIAIGPAPDSKVSAITGHLALL